MARRIESPTEKVLAAEERLLEGVVLSDRLARPVTGVPLIVTSAVQLPLPQTASSLLIVPLKEVLKFFLEDHRIPDKLQ